jgi:hypothetical protein
MIADGFGIQLQIHFNWNFSSVKEQETAILDGAALCIAFPRKLWFITKSSAI